MVEAQDITPFGGEEGTRARMVPGPAVRGVSPSVGARRTAGVSDRASIRHRAGHRTVPLLAANQCRRERRPIL
jgi:hypothetical protein